MKWYSVKKYIPSTDFYYLINASNHASSTGTSFYAFAHAVHINNSENIYSWDILFSDSVDDLDDFEVTHFAIIEPVEIEQTE